MAAQVAALVLLGLIALGVAWFDGRERRIPNWLVALTLVVGLAVTLIAGGLAALPGHVVHAAIALAVAITLYAMGTVGAGDAKLYAALAVWFGLSDGWSLLLYVAMSGFVLLVVWFGYRRLAGKPVPRRAQSDKDRLPYGLAIAAGAFLLQLRFTVT